MKRIQPERGVSLAETMIAIVVALFGVFSLGALIFQTTATNKNQGTETTRATIYAQDKIEGLLAIGSPTGVGAATFVNCAQAASSQPAICNTTGITDTGWTQGLLAGGQIATLVPTCPNSGTSVGYVDYLDANGIQFVGSCSTVAGMTPSYVRHWLIQDVTGSNPALKQITVAVYSQAAVAAGGGKPIVILTSFLTNPN